MMDPDTSQSLELLLIFSVFSSIMFGTISLFVTDSTVIRIIAFSFPFILSLFVFLREKLSKPSK